jgi:methylenetetrahydrofolate reductase (NADPH)
MYVTEHLDRATNPLFSYEIIPPPRGRSARDILDIVERLVPFQPPFIDVTSHGATAEYEKQPDGQVIRRVTLKRPGTISICGIIQNRYNIDTVPHLLCRGFTREETENAMIELNFLGIQNVLAIRGDETNYQKPLSSGRTVNDYANELVEQLDGLRQGTYLEDLADTEPITMCLGVAGYPETHVEANSQDDDIAALKRKVDAGADYIVTQMFFDNAEYFGFVKRCRLAGIQVPIIPGLKVINSVRQLASLPKYFHLNLPTDLVGEINASPDHVREIGRNWAIKQSRELLENGVKCIHFFVVRDVKTVLKTIKSL